MSSSSFRPKWDVFLSFRGEDTRKNFTDHLYLALNDAGIHTFRDDNELRRGEEISLELLKAIEGSRICVIVFSRNYATSRWCLEELVKIMECRKTGMRMVLPIFYDVDPSDIRYQKGSFAEAFKKHEERFLLDKDKVLRWRMALTEAASLSGWNLRNTADGHEGKFIRKIVGQISQELNNGYLFVATYPIGIDFHVQEMTSLLGVGADDVRMIGIWGMGGMGKTTIAKAIYNELYHNFEDKSFLENIRERSKQPNGLVTLQEQLLFDILKLKKSKVKASGVSRGSKMIEERLCGRRVLVILDDVDELDQLKAIAGRRDWFGSGSRIIVTTRDEQLLKAHDVDGIYPAEKMNDNESLELFSWHAFRNSNPDKDYIDISKNIVAYSGGLPLALEVLGSSLVSRTISEWKSALEKLKRIPHDQIQKKLKISFDALQDYTVKDIFLDISCFFIGMDKNYVVQILDGCGLSSEIGVSQLIQCSLLRVGERNKLVMHDLLRDMGREIVRERSSNELGKYSRLWINEDAIYILAEQKGTSAVEGLTLKLPRFSKMSFSTKAFEEMQRLRLLQLDHAQLTGECKYLSKELRWLRWHGFPLEFIPNNFYQRNLVAIDLRYSNLKQVWKNPKLLKKLKILNLSHSLYLTRTPDFSTLPMLERLILKDCPKLFEVHQSIGDLCKLVLVNLKDCTNLKSLPRSFYKLKSLETLILSGCSKLCLSLSGCGGSISTSKLLPSLFWSRISPRKSPKSINLLPTSLQGLKSLTKLSLNGCNLSDDALPRDLGSLCSLQSLNLGGNSFHILPSSLGGLSKLRRLNLRYCTKLRSIPDLPPDLFNLNARDCHELVEIPGFNLRYCKFLFIRMEGCNGFTNILQGLIMGHVIGPIGHRHRIFSIYVSSCCEIPDWFTYMDEGSSVCFKVVLPIIDPNFERFAVCIVYSSSCPFLGILPSISVINHTKNIVQSPEIVYRIGEVISHEDCLWLGIFFIRDCNLEGGDEVEVIVDFGPEFIVKKTGLYHHVVGVKSKRGLADDDEAGPSHASFDEERQPKRLRCETNNEISIDEEEQI